MIARGLLIGALLLPIEALSVRSSEGARPDTNPGSDQLRRMIESAPRLSDEGGVLPMTLPKGQQVRMISWMAFDPKKGFLWVIQRGPNADPILAIDRTGAVVHSFGKGMFTTPHSIRLDTAGNVWAVDAGTSRVMEFSPTGEKLLQFDVGEPTSSASFGGATDIAFGPSGRIYVSDGYRNARVIEYTSRGTKVMQWGSKGGGPGEFNLPHSIVIDARGTVYVADRENGRIEKFTLSGKYVGEIGHLGRVYALSLGPQNTLWVTMQRLNEPPGSSGWIVKLNRETGQILGYIPVSEHGGLHCVEHDGADEPMTDIGNTVVRFAKKRSSAGSSRLGSWQ